MTLIARRIAAASALALAVSAAQLQAQSLDGRWDASLTQGDTVIPFRLDIATVDGQPVGTLYNGEMTQTTTKGALEDGQLVLEFGHYLTTIHATVTGAGLAGRVDLRNGQQGGSRFEAVRHTSPPAPAGPIPSIGGSWVIPFEPGNESPKGEKAWRFIVKQNGAEVSATTLRIDGDTGALTGRYRDDGTFVVSHFDGQRPGLMELTPLADGTLQIVSRGSVRNGRLVAYRSEAARAAGLPEPADATTHTTMRDPSEIFTFSFPDVNGTLVTNEDPQFKGKVVVAVVTGTWCPNCHDEARYLVQLHDAYHDRGLQIVALDFEEPEQQDELARVKAFVAKYGIPYPYLIAGAPVEMWEKVPQAVNLNTWPATFFIGRDGRVKHIHAGFAAPASGEFYEALKAEFTSTIERLLAEPAPTTTVTAAGAVQ